MFDDILSKSAIGQGITTVLVLVVAAMVWRTVTRRPDGTSPPLFNARPGAAWQGITDRSGSGGTSGEISQGRNALAVT